MQKNQNISNIIFLHILIITISNFFVQHPFTILGLHTTWGAFTYPLIFITTDLTVRLLGQHQARKVIFKAMLPGLFVSYLVSVLFVNGQYQSLTNLFSLNIVAFRISLACFMAYIIGQLLDIFVFQKLRNNRKWWLAPSASGFLGNFVDTIVFFSIAFYHSTIPVLRDHWLEIAAVDFCFKYLFTIFCFVPLYGIILNTLLKKHQRELHLYNCAVAVEKNETLNNEMQIGM